MYVGEGITLLLKEAVEEKDPDGLQSQSRAVLSSDTFKAQLNEFCDLILIHLTL